MQTIEASDVTAEETGIDAAHIRSQRQDFQYDLQQNLSQPVIIRGTNRIFRSAPGLNIEDKPSKESLDTLIERAREVDTHLRLQRLPSVAAIKIDIVTPDVITFKVEGRDDIFYFETPISKKNPLAFKRFSSFLQIPYAFSKKNPTFLNKVNFDYYLRNATVTQQKPTAIDLVYDAEPNEISYLPTTAEGQEVEGSEVQKVQAYRVSNVLKAPRARGRSKDDEPVETPPIATRIPFFSDILAGVKNQLHEFAPEIDPQLQAYSLGYDDSNKGRHFARIVFDSPATNFDLFGEKYQLGLNVETDFSGDSKDFGNVGISFILFRQICSNGMMAAWDSADQARMRETYVTEQLQAAGFTIEDAQDGGVEEAVDIRRQSEARFHVIFGERGIQIPVAQANAGLDTSNFTLGLRFFLESKTLQEARLQALKNEFAAIEEEDFIRAIHGVQDSFKLASPELVKYFVLEYLAGEVTGKQQFKSPFDVVNFFTLLGRAYDTAVVADIERKAIGFAMELYSRVNQTKAEKEVSLASQYRSQLNTRLLGTEAE